MNTDVRQSATGRHSSWEWWATALIAVAAFGFGFTGMKEYAQMVSSSGHVDMWSVFYHTLQLFLLHAPHLDGPIPWQLHVGRLLGAMPLCITAVMAFIKIFPDEWNLMVLRLPWTRGHVVICGLGDVGLRLALEGRRRKKRIVAIEKACSLETLRFVRGQGVLVLDGDASSEAHLKAARVDRAEFVVASCPHDSTNAVIAAKVGRIVESNRDHTVPLVCRTMIRNLEVRRFLSESPLLSSQLSAYRVNFNDLDQHAEAARQAFWFHPLDLNHIREDDETVVRLVVIGFGISGQNLALQGARIGHFANETGRSKRLLVTVVEPTEAAVVEFQARYSNLHLVCDMEPPITKLQTAYELATLCEPNMQVTYAFCWEDRGGDERNFTSGMDLLRHLKCPATQVLIRQSTQDGFAGLISDNTLGTDGRVHPFGMIEDIFSWDVLLRESQNVLARELHEAYRALYPAARDWEHLSEDFRDSNRQAADHIPIKLRALGYHLEKAGRPGRIFLFQKPEVELLAKMEHARFCAERWLAGWTYGPQTIRDRKINRTLVRWDDLPPEEAQKDHGQINAIPGALDRMGLGIYR